MYHKCNIVATTIFGPLAIASAILKERCAVIMQSGAPSREILSMTETLSKYYDKLEGSLEYGVWRQARMLAAPVQDSAPV